MAEHPPALGEHCAGCRVPDAAGARRCTTTEERGRPYGCARSAGVRGRKRRCATMAIVALVLAAHCTRQAQGKRLQTSVLSRLGAEGGGGQARAGRADALAPGRRSLHRMEGAGRADSRRDAPGLPIESNEMEATAEDGESRDTGGQPPFANSREQSPLLVYPIFSSKWHQPRDRGRSGPSVEHRSARSVRAALLAAVPACPCYDVITGVYAA